MKQLDLYIVRKFLVTFLYMNLILTLVIVIFDISEKIDDFIENNIPLKAIVFEYYFNFIPYLLNMFIGLIIFIAVIYFTSRLAFNTEIVAMLAAGVSFRRIMLPYGVIAFLLAGFSFALSNFIIPAANAKRMHYEMHYMNKHRPNYENYVHFQISQGETIALQHFDPFANSGYKVVLASVDSAGIRKVVTAEFLRWDSTNFIWNLEQYSIRVPNDTGERFYVGHSLDTTLAIRPHHLTSRIISVDNLGYRKLRKFIVESRMRGSENILYYEVEKHKRLAYPFSTVILTLIGMSLSSRKVRGGIGWHIAIGLFASFSYILFMKFAETFATSGNVTPFIAVWIPNVIYLALGLFLFHKAPK